MGRANLIVTFQSLYHKPVISLNPTIIRAVGLQIDLGLDYSLADPSKKLTSINLIHVHFMKKDNLRQGPNGTNSNVLVTQAKVRSNACLSLAASQNQSTTLLS